MLTVQRKWLNPLVGQGNTETPALDVPEDQRQSGRCIDCTQNIKGSGRGTGRACRFVQRLALVLEDDLETVYQLQLPPTSIFGEAMEGGCPFVHTHDTLRRGKRLSLL